MYNTITEDIISGVPLIDGIDPAGLPHYLTQVFAKIVTLRIKLNREQNPLAQEVKLLRKLANNLETLTVLHSSSEHRTSCAFVAGTAHHLLHQIKFSNNRGLDVDQVPSTISAIILFLIAGSPADAAEVASDLKIERGDDIRGYLYKSIGNMARGRIGIVRSTQVPTKNYPDGDWDNEAQDYLWSLLCLGIKQLAEQLLGLSESQVDYFGQVKELSLYSKEDGNPNGQSCYVGPYHLSILLGLLQEKLLQTGIINVAKPEGAGQDDWWAFLKRLAADRPYLWSNHVDAINTGFLDKGRSAVLAFPTGAGKTTVSELKIASSIMSGDAVLYLVPTHALEDQVKRDLGRLFDNIGGEGLEIGGEFTEADENLAVINVMTPERCLTMLSLAPEEFQQIGLVVFDEFHLISGRQGRDDQRSLDAMFCMLRLFSEIPNADYLLISAMVDNSIEVAAWVSSLTGRRCEAFNSKWKPTRQLQGCIVYPQEQIDYLDQQIFKYRSEVENPRPTNAALTAQIKAHAYQIFSLQNLWDPQGEQKFYLAKLLKNQLQLAVSPQWRVTSNRNKVAAELAAGFIRQGIKTIIFVDNPNYTSSTATTIEGLLGPRDIDTESFATLNATRINALELELGDLRDSHFSVSQQVAVHHGLLMPVERQLNEAFFKKSDGLHALVATATLAQGINLPAEVVIIAGDDRFDEDTDAREALQPHEILNTAGRAGRAGSSAQGIVLIVPGKVIQFEHKDAAPQEWLNLRENIFSKSDQCLTIVDPMTRFLDEINVAGVEDNLTPISDNLLLRLHVDQNSSHSVSNVFTKSFAYFQTDPTLRANFDSKIQKAVERRENLGIDLLYHHWVETASLKTGIDPEIINQLSRSLSEIELETLLGYDIVDWIGWFLRWMENNVPRMMGMFPTMGSRGQLARALGMTVTNYRLADVARRILELEPPIYMYIRGGNYKQINDLIPGANSRYLKKARRFVLRLMPNLSFAMGAMVLTLKERYKYQDIELPFEIRQLATMVKEGLDTEDKLRFKLTHRSYMRMQIHQAFEPLDEDK
jgi:superfamily II DNA/RNA helicase